MGKHLYGNQKIVEPWQPLEQLCLQREQGGAIAEKAWKDVHILRESRRTTAQVPSESCIKKFPRFLHDDVY